MSRTVKAIFRRTHGKAGASEVPPTAIDMGVVSLSPTSHLPQAQTAKPEFARTPALGDELGDFIFGLLLVREYKHSCSARSLGLSLVSQLVLCAL